MDVLHGLEDKLEPSLVFLGPVFFEPSSEFFLQSCPLSRAGELRVDDEISDVPVVEHVVIFLVGLEAGDREQVVESEMRIPGDVFDDTSHGDVDYSSPLPKGNRPADGILIAEKLPGRRRSENDRGRRRESRILVAADQREGKDIQKILVDEYSFLGESFLPGLENGLDIRSGENPGRVADLGKFCFEEGSEEAWKVDIEFSGCLSRWDFSAGHPVNSSRFLMKTVVAHLEPGIGRDQDEASQPGREAEDHDQRKSFVFQ